MSTRSLSSTSRRLAERAHQRIQEDHGPMKTRIWCWQKAEGPWSCFFLFWSVLEISCLCWHSITACLFFHILDMLIWRILIFFKELLGDVETRWNGGQESGSRRHVDMLLWRQEQVGGMFTGSERNWPDDLDVFLLKRLASYVLASLLEASNGCGQSMLKRQQQKAKLDSKLGCIYIHVGCVESIQ